jgi:hypothetical protein
VGRVLSSGTLKTSAGSFSNFKRNSFCFLLVSLTLIEKRMRRKRNRYRHILKARGPFCPFHSPRNSSWNFQINFSLQLLYVWQKRPQFAAARGTWLPCLYSSTGTSRLNGFTSPLNGQPSHLRSEFLYLWLETRIWELAQLLQKAHDHSDRSCGAHEPRRVSHNQISPTPVRCGAGDVGFRQNVKLIFLKCLNVVAAQIVMVKH